MSDHTVRSPWPDNDLRPALVDAEVLREAQHRPQAMAMVEAPGGRTVTFGQLDDGVTRVAAGLASRGVGRGDVVATVAGNTLDHAVVLLGGLRAGAAVAGANPALPPAELARQFARTRPSVVFADPAAAPAARSAAGSSAWVVTSIEDLLGAPTRLIAPRDPAAPCCLFNSSGTSGLPKTVVHTHATMTAFLQMFGAQPVMALRPTDVVLLLVPLAHLYGTGLLCHSLRCGARVVCWSHPGFDLELYLRALQDHRVTVCPVTPPVLRALARHPAVADHDLSALRLVIAGAAPCPPGLTSEAEERLGCQVVDAWGMTECWCAVPPAVPAVHGSVGRVAPNHAARIVDPESGATLGPGEVGELWIRGPQVMIGYLDDPAATAATLDAEGWLHTGDLFRFDGDGNAFYVDRLKDLIKVGGYSVAPAEIEAELLTHPCVTDAAVVGRDDPEWGQVPSAFVVLGAPAEPDELHTWLASRLAPWKQPRDIVVVDAVPRHPTGKLLRRMLRSEAGSVIG